MRVNTDAMSPADLLERLPADPRAVGGRLAEARAALDAARRTLNEEERRRRGWEERRDRVRAQVSALTPDDSDEVYLHAAGAQLVATTLDRVLSATAPLLHQRDEEARGCALDVSNLEQRYLSLRAHLLCRASGGAAGVLLRDRADSGVVDEIRSLSGV